jgi:hypothetical protein
MRSRQSELDKAIENYLAVRTAGALGLTAEQVKTINYIERDADERIEVSLQGDRPLVEWVEDGWFFYAYVNADGTLDTRS